MEKTPCCYSLATYNTGILDNNIMFLIHGNSNPETQAEYLIPNTQSRISYGILLIVHTVYTYIIPHRTWAVNALAKKVLIWNKFRRDIIMSNSTPNESTGTPLRTVYIVDGALNEKTLDAKFRGIDDERAKSFVVLTFREVDRPREIKAFDPDTEITIISDNTTESVRDGIKIRKLFQSYKNLAHIAVAQLEGGKGARQTVAEWIESNSDKGASRLMTEITLVAQTVRKSDPWQLPQPINDGVTFVSFPIHIFPAPIQIFIERLSYSMGATDTTLASVLTVDAVRAATLKKLKVAYPREDESGGYLKPDHFHHVNSFDLIIGKSSAGKTTAAKAIARPFREWYRLKAPEYDRIKSDAEAGLLAVNSAIDELEKSIKGDAKAAAKSGGEVGVDITTKERLSELKQERKELERVIKFDYKQVCTSGDITMEKLPEIFKNSGGIFTLFDDEGRVFEILLESGQNGGVSRTDTINRAWDGDDVTKRRVGNGDDEAPDAVFEFVTLTHSDKEIASNGRLNTKGTNARCLAWVQEDGDDDAKHSRDLSEEDRAAYKAMIWHFLEWQACYDDDDSLNANALEFSDKARHVIVNTYQEIMDTAKESGDDSERAWARKRGKSLCSTASMFQLMYAYFGDPTVEGDTGNPNITREEFLKRKIGVSAAYAAKAYVLHAIRNRQQLNGESLEREVLWKILNDAINPSGKIKGRRDEIVADRATLSTLRGNTNFREKLKTWATTYHGDPRCSISRAIVEVLLELTDLGYFVHIESLEDGKDHFRPNPFLKDVLDFM